MSGETKVVSRPWQKHLRYSVRGLILVVLVIGGGLGWMVRSARMQRDAVAAIQSSGGIVTYDWGWKDGAYLGNAGPWAPYRLVDALGADYFGSVVVVRCYGRESDAEVAQIGRLTALVDLSLAGNSVTDAGLAELKGLAGLRRLEIHSKGVTDAGLAHLKGLTDLRELILSGTQITNDGLAQIEGMTNLAVLSLGSTQVTDAGLAHLRRLTDLSVLSLSGTQVTDAGLSHLEGLTRLSKLWLVRTQVTNAGVQHLQRALPGLQITR